MSLLPRAVVVHRTSERDEMVARHGTRQQAAWFLETRGRALAELDERHDALATALATVAGAVPTDWRRATVERADLDRFAFGPENVVVVVGPDGLVANVAKYLDGQPVIGVDPEPGRNAGVLVTHRADDVARILAGMVGAGGAAAVPVQERTMVQATTDDGQVLLALNEVYVGHASHQSARYVLEAPDGARERQSSSGLLAGTGTGCTGWLRSAWQERRSDLVLPGPTDPAVCWFAREAWPSPATGTTCTEGAFGADGELTVRAESDRLVCFGDGIEHDALTLTWGQRLTIAVAPRRLRLVV